MQYLFTRGGLLVKANFDTSLMRKKKEQNHRKNYESVEKGFLFVKLFLAQIDFIELFS